MTCQQNKNAWPQPMWYLGVLVVWLLASPSMAQELSSKLGHQVANGTVATIPVNALNLEEAIVTVSVMRQPSSPIANMLRMCRSKIAEELGLDDEELLQQGDFLRQLVETLLDLVSEPVHVDEELVRQIGFPRSVGREDL